MNHFIMEGGSWFELYVKYNLNNAYKRAPGMLVAVGHHCKNKNLYLRKEGKEEERNKE